MYQRYDNNTFFKAVHWCKRNIRKGKSRLKTYEAAEKYYGVDATRIQNYLLKYEKEFMSIDYHKYPNHTISDYKIQKNAESMSHTPMETLFEMYVKPRMDRSEYPDDYTNEDIAAFETAKLNKILKDLTPPPKKVRTKSHEDPYADL